MARRRAPRRKSGWTKRYTCAHSMWPGFKRGGGGAGYRCRDHKTGRWATQGHCKRCPTSVKTSWGKRGYKVAWGRK